MSKRVILMGTPDFAAHIFERFINEAGYEVVSVITQPDKPVGRKREIKPTPVKAVALKHGIPVLQPGRVRDIEADIAALHPDLIITAAYGQLVPQAILDIPEFGCINVHASLLPKYRGGAPIHWSIINGEAETGITIMYMEKRLDAGDMLSVVKTDISDDDTLGSVYERLTELGGELLLATVPKLFAGELEAEKQDDSAMTLAPNIQSEHQRLDWHQAARACFNRIRGLNPAPGAFTTLHNKRMKLWASQLTGEATAEAAGRIVGTDSNGILVACGDGKVLCVTELQYEGKGRMKALDFYNGNRGMLEGAHFE